MLAGLLVVNVTALLEAPGVAVSVAGPAPNTTGEAAAKPVMNWGASVMFTLAWTVTAAA